MKVSLYQVATQEIDEEQNQPKDGYKWNEHVQTWIEQNKPEYSDVEDFYKKVKDNAN